MHTRVYEVKIPFEHNGKRYHTGRFIFEIENLPQQGIGDILNGRIVNPIPIQIYADRIAPYQNWQSVAVHAQGGGSG